MSTASDRVKRFLAVYENALEELAPAPADQSPEERMEVVYIALAMFCRCRRAGRREEAIESISIVIAQLEQDLSLAAASGTAILGIIDVLQGDVSTSPIAADLYRRAWAIRTEVEWADGLNGRRLQ